MAIEMDKINKECREHNMITDFGLISWAHINELFPWTDIPTKKLETCILLIGPSEGGTTRMPHPRTTFKGSH
jgi:hypothetical protein